MEALKRRAEHLAREIDIRRKMDGEPSTLDLRPVGGPMVDEIIEAWSSLLTIDGWNGRASIPFERASHFIDRSGWPEMVRRIFSRLTALRNRHYEEQREAEAAKR